MRYAKDPLTLDEQVELLRSRGLQGDLRRLRDRLRDVSYYRLAGYLFPFRATDDTFRPGTTVELVWEHYVFDRQLRLLVLDALERVEVAVRTRLTYRQAHSFGPFGIWNDPTSFTPKRGSRQERLDGFRKEIERNQKERFLEHFYTKYGDVHSDPPIWMATEVFSFGSIVRLLDESAAAVRSAVAGSFGVPDEVFVSWLRTLNFVRNVCAHHGRLWNRTLAYPVKLPNPRKHPDWHVPVPVGNNRVFVVLTILNQLLAQVAPGSSWPRRARGLLDEYPRVPLRSMGFPADWLTSPLWKGARDGA